MSEMCTNCGGCGFIFHDHKKETPCHRCGQSGVDPGDGVSVAHLKSLLATGLEVANIPTPPEFDEWQGKRNVWVQEVLEVLKG